MHFVGNASHCSSAHSSQQSQIAVVRLSLEADASNTLGLTQLSYLGIFCATALADTSLKPDISFGHLLL